MSDKPPRLRSVEGLPAELVIDLVKSGLIGRDPAADFRVEHPTVSRKHAEVKIDGQKVELTDLGSANGSRINGRPLSRSAYMLGHGDLVQLGQILFEYEEPVSAAAATKRQSLAETTKPSRDARKAKMLASDMRLARRIQHRLVPDKPPTIAGYEVAFSYVPALAIGGDYFDITELPNNELAITIGDVSGKGVSGALYMVFVSAVLRARLHSAKGPAEFLTEVNRRMCPILEPGMFVTLSTMFLNTQTHVCRLALAGHNPPVLRSASKKVVEMGLDPGHPIGASEDLVIRDQRLQLAPGDIMLFTTDGVEEGENENKEPFGTTRRNQAMRVASGAADMNRRVRTELLNFCGAEVSSDDLTIIAVERLLSS